MADAIRDQSKLMNRVKRIRGQLNGIEKSLERERNCGDILQQLAACRGALNGLMAEILEDHVRYHVVDPATPSDSEQAEAAVQLIDLVRAYLR